MCVCVREEIGGWWGVRLQFRVTGGDQTGEKKCDRGRLRHAEVIKAAGDTGQVGLLISHGAPEIRDGARTSIQSIRGDGNYKNFLLQSLRQRKLKSINSCGGHMKVGDFSFPRVCTDLPGRAASRSPAGLWPR